MATTKPAEDATDYIEGFEVDGNGKMIQTDSHLGTLRLGTAQSIEYQGTVTAVLGTYYDMPVKAGAGYVNFSKTVPKLAVD